MYEIKSKTKSNQWYCHVVYLLGVASEVVEGASKIKCWNQIGRGVLGASWGERKW